MSISIKQFQFFKQHFLWPLLIFVIIVYVFEVFQLDLIIADWFYIIEGHQWSLRNHYLTKIILHDRAQNLSKLLGVSFLLLAISSHFVRRLVPYERGLWLLFLSFSISAAIVAIGKSITHVDCPWDIQRYGGARPYLSLFDAHTGGFKFGRCFPSGHASGGYGLLGLYFFFYHYKPEWKWLGLGVSLLMGLLYGFTQQLRGAHFLSHDLWTLGICWLIAFLIHYRLLKTNQSV
jgi:membrane-associated PAP2 superfamily phosphatase